MSSLSSRISTDDHVCHGTGVRMEGVGGGCMYVGGVGGCGQVECSPKLPFFNVDTEVGLWNCINLASSPGHTPPPTIDWPGIHCL